MMFGEEYITIMGEDGPIRIKNQIMNLCQECL